MVLRAQPQQVVSVQAGGPPFLSSGARIQEAQVGFLTVPVGEMAAAAIYDLLFAA